MANIVHSFSTVSLLSKKHGIHEYRYVPSVERSPLPFLYLRYSYVSYPRYGGSAVPAVKHFVEYICHLPRRYALRIHRQYEILYTDKSLIRFEYIRNTSSRSLNTLSSSVLPYLVKRSLS
ncbi:hypothetical protein [Thermoplasma acidophilum]|uniref:Uncharacterized protein n=1 Tax=Thermoplasma acidophilum (strain ATCC 25905 / DSM 1728 / JCM 9062 / NBRC 15155 / AMRC-C165) TaxID=273075 RepID=Q9HLN9_THEAC|nr:hypothetical protein [Thermoplasma acidophilum]